MSLQVDGNLYRGCTRVETQLLKQLAAAHVDAFSCYQARYLSQEVVEF